MKRMLFILTAIVLFLSHKPCLAQGPIERFFSINNTYWQFMGIQPVD